MPILKCVGCQQELWWFGDTPPICKKCASDPAPIISALREQVRLLSLHEADGACTCRPDQARSEIRCSVCGGSVGTPYR